MAASAATGALTKATNGGGSELAKPHTFSGSVSFNSTEDALMVLTSVVVDAELRVDQVSRELKVEGNEILIRFEATEARLLRSAVGTCLELLNLATATLERFRI